MRSFLSFFKKTDSKSGNARKILIGTLLAKENVITNEQLVYALEVQSKRRQRLTSPLQLGMILVELGYATESQVVKVINDHYGLSVKSLTDNVEGLIRKKQKKLSGRFLPASIPTWFQLSVLTTMVITITILSLSFIILKFQREQLYRQAVSIGKISLKYFAQNAQIPMLGSDDLRLNTLIREATTDEGVKYVQGIRYVVITDKNQTIIAHTNTEKIGEIFKPASEIQKSVKDGAISYFDYISPKGEHILNLYRNIEIDGKKLGEVHLGISLDFIELLIKEKKLMIAKVSLAIIGVGIFVAILLGIHFARPISQLAMATREIAKGNYHYQVTPVRNDEIGDLTIAFNRMSRELWMKSVIQKSFGKYVGKDVLEMILGNPESEWLKGQKSNATVLFTDIRGFTSYAESKEPYEIVDKLNQYFEIVTNIILKYGGYVDKFVGDAVLAVFGVPVFCEDHMEKAVRAAVEIEIDLCKKAGLCDNPLLGSIGIGINSGIVVHGNIGSQIKMEYTVIGDTVNIASRLNGLAGSGEIIISEAIWKNLNEKLITKEMAPQKIKGRVNPIRVYKVLGIRDKKKDEKKRDNRSNGGRQGV